MSLTYMGYYTRPLTTLFILGLDQCVPNFSSAVEDRHFNLPSSRSTVRNPKWWIVQILHCCQYPCCFLCKSATPFHCVWDVLPCFVWICLYNSLQPIKWGKNDGTISRLSSRRILSCAVLHAVRRTRPGWSAVPRRTVNAQWVQNLLASSLYQQTLGHPSDFSDKLTS